MNCYFPWSRHHAYTGGPDLLIIFFKCSLKSKWEAHGEKNLKNCLENSENSLKHVSLATGAQWIEIIDNYTAIEEDLLNTLCTNYISLKFVSSA